MMQVEEAAKLGSSLVAMGQKCWIQRQIMDESCLHVYVHL